MTQPTSPRPRSFVPRPLRWLWQQHLLGSLFIVLLGTLVIAAQVEGRDDFAGTQLGQDVESRWGDKVVQPAPSVRAVQSGTVFTQLTPLPLDRQHVEVQAQMNYRKRGLRYFSGFDFTFSAQYELRNREDHDIDVAFIFPIEVDKSQVLLSDLTFLVNGREAALDLGEARNRLVWTGRVPRGEAAQFAIRYRARGLQSLQYKLDPALPARDVRVRIGVVGGSNFDYPEGVLSAGAVQEQPDAVTLEWKFGSLESGVNLGVVLPSVRSFDRIIATMAHRAWFFFGAFVLLVGALAARHRRPLRTYDAYLLAAAFAFTFILLAYLAAFMNFYLAYAVSTLLMGTVVTAALRAHFPRERAWVLAGPWLATAVIPTGAVILQGYTGLIYTLELLAALLVLLTLSTRPAVRALLSDLPSSQGAAPFASR
jgi:hypothetical protein